MKLLAFEFSNRPKTLCSIRHLASATLLLMYAIPAQAQSFCADKGRAWAEVGQFERADAAITFADRALSRFPQRRVYQRRDGRFSVVTGQVRQGTTLPSPPYPRVPVLVNGCDFTSRIWGSPAANAEDSGEAARSRAQQIEGLKTLAPAILDALNAEQPGSKSKRCGYHAIDSDGKRVVRFEAC